MHKILLTAIVVLVVLGALLVLAQLWAVFINPDIFVKLLITIGILIVLLGFLLVVKIDFGEHKRLKDENYLD